MENSLSYQTEVKSQETYWLLYVVGNLLYFLLFAVIASNGHEVVGLLAFCLQIAYNLRTWPAKIREFEERLMIVAFKQQVHNLYVFSLEPSDDTVRERFEEAFKLLEEVGNKHGVTVHMVIFQDACIFSSRWKTSGQRHNERRWRESGSTFESWEEYEQYCEEFQLHDNDKRIRELRADDKGRDWVSGIIYGQQITDDES